MLSMLVRPIVFEHLSALLSSAAQYSILLIERAVVSLLRLVQVLAPQVSLLSWMSCDVLRFL